MSTTTTNPQPPRLPKHVLYLRGVDERLKREFKSRCALSGMTLTGGIQLLMRQLVDGKIKFGV